MSANSLAATYHFNYDMVGHSGQVDEVAHAGNEGEATCVSCSYDETHMAFVPISYNFPPVATKYFAGEGGYQPSRSPGWHDWGEGEALLPVLCAATGHESDPPTSIPESLCPSLAGRRFSAAALDACYGGQQQADMDTPAAAQTEPQCQLSPMQLSIIRAVVSPNVKCNLTLGAI